MKIIDIISEAKSADAVSDLKRDLLAAKKRGKKMNYDGVAEVMEKIWTKYRMTGQELHDVFVKAVGMIPDTWIKKQKLKTLPEDTKYLGPEEKVKNISPVLTKPYGSAKQTKLMNKFFGSN